MSYLCQKCKKMGVTVFVSDIKRVENYPDFDKLAHVIQHGLQWFIVNNYSPTWRWLVVADTEVNSCFSIY